MRAMSPMYTENYQIRSSPLYCIVYDYLQDHSQPSGWPARRERIRSGRNLAADRSQERRQVPSCVPDSEIWPDLHAPRSDYPEGANADSGSPTCQVTGNLC